MKKNMLKNRIAVIAAVGVIIMTGCHSNTEDSAETEALRNQIAQLEQKITALEQQAVSESDNALKEIPSTAAKADSDSQAETITDNSTKPQSDEGLTDSQPQENDTSVGNYGEPHTNNGNEHFSGHDEGAYHNSEHSVGAGTTYTIEDLSSLVDAFVAKANAAAPGGTVSQDMEQFFALKQDEKQIDDMLDQHEDELEYLYKNQIISREEYKRLERELEYLEDSLDDAEDKLERAFGIDD